MSDNDVFDDSNVEEEVKASEGWKSLRSARDKLAKELADARAELGQAAAAKRSGTLADLLKAKNVSEKVAKFYPADSDVTDVSVAAWLDENSEIFGGSPAGSVEPKIEADTPAVTQARKVAEAAATAPGTPPAGLDQVNAALKALDPKDKDFLSNFQDIMGAYTP